MLRRDLTTVSHKIEHLLEYQCVLDKKNKKKAKVDKNTSRALWQREVRKRIGFDSISDLGRYI